MSFIQALIDLSNAMAPYILFGLLIAGFLHEAVSQNFIQKHLGKSNTSSVIKATLFGIPIPVCSCGVIPLATSLQKSGASKGAVLSFLISTPITGIDSILATYGIFGFAFTVYRIFTSLIIAISAGLIVNRFNIPTPKKAFFTLTKPTTAIETSCCKESCECETGPKQRFSLKNAFIYAFGTLLGDIAKPLFWGLLIGAAIEVGTPKDLSVLLTNHPTLAYIITIAIAVPMYVCATASLPIAAALMMQGVSLGAAFVFLSAGPATNTVTIGVVKKMLGKKATIVYLTVIILGSITFGLILDQFITFHMIQETLLSEHKENIGYFSSLTLWLLLFFHLFNNRFLSFFTR